jgi:hypothetical protein
MHPCSLVFQDGERNRITPAVRLKGHSARLPSGLLAFASVRLHIRNDQPIGHSAADIHFETSIRHRTQKRLSAGKTRITKQTAGLR